MRCVECEYKVASFPCSPFSACFCDMQGKKGVEPRDKAEQK